MGISLCSQSYHGFKVAAASRLGQRLKPAFWTLLMARLEVMS